VLYQKGTALTRLIQDAAVPMLHKKVIESLDLHVKTFGPNNEQTVKGGLLTLIWGGAAGGEGSRQFLPVIPHGTRANIVNASLKKSQLWEQVYTSKLTQNMSVLKTGGD